MNVFSFNCGKERCSKITKNNVNKPKNLETLNVSNNNGMERKTSALGYCMLNNLHTNVSDPSL
jgi:hypothetical protein